MHKQSGDSLAQTVLTCLYIVDGAVNKEKDEYLNAVIMSTKNSCSSVLEFVNEARVFEEEDFVPLRYGYRLGNESVVTTSSEELKDESLLQCTIAQLDIIIDCPTSTINKFSEIQLNDQIEKSQGENVSHIHIQNSAIITKIKSHPSQTELDTSRCMVCISALRKRMVVRRNMERVFARIAHSQVALKGTHNKSDIQHCLNEVIKSIQEIDDCHEYSQYLVGFNGDVSRRMLGPTPVRKSTVISPQKAYEELLLMFTQMLKACDVMDCKSFDDLVEFIQDFCASNVGVLPRSLLWLIISGREEGLLGDLILKAMSGNHIDLSKSTSLSNFISTKALDPVTKLLRAYCSNPGRQRRKLQNCISAWSDTFAITSNVDRQDDTKDVVKTSGSGLENTWWGENLSFAWVEDTVIKQEIWYLFYGFTLELYDSNEYLSIYCYLEYCIGRLINGMELRRGSVQEAMKKTNAANTFPLNDTSAYGESMRSLTFDILLWSVKRFMCQGYVRLLVGIKKTMSLTASCRRNFATDLPDYYNKEVERYHQRFSCLWGIPHPEAVTYDDFVAATSAEEYVAEDLYHLALPCFNQARNLITQLKSIVPHQESVIHVSNLSPSIERFCRFKDEIARLERIAIKTEIATNVLIKRCSREDNDLNVHFEFDSHSFFASCHIYSKL